MAKQRESKLVGDPFDVFMKHKGWHYENIHGNQYQQGLPDRFMVRKGQQIWVEYKVIEQDGSIHTTDAQKKKFPTLIKNGVPIYAICARDLRPATMQTAKELAWLYQSIILGPKPNGYMLFKKILWPQLNIFCKPIPVSKRKGRTK
jgi:hypothetical protein